jgi:hypothetical protein
MAVELGVSSVRVTETSTGWTPTRRPHTAVITSPTSSTTMVSGDWRWHAFGPVVLDAFIGYRFLKYVSDDYCLFRSKWWNDALFFVSSRAISGQCLCIAVSMNVVLQLKRNKQWIYLHSHMVHSVSVLVGALPVEFGSSVVISILHTD